MTLATVSVNNKNIPKIAIIGGGLTGLFTATLLERQFADHQDRTGLPQIIIFEKSGGVGRLATRYRKDEATSKNWQWSFGAQFFTAKSDSFSQFIAPWLTSSLLQPWCAKVVSLTGAQDHNDSPKMTQKEQWDTEHARYISTPKMTSWGRQLASELRRTTIKFKTHVAPLAQLPDHQTDYQISHQTELFADNGGSLGRFDWVICTAPNVQAMALMTDSGFIEYSKIMQPKMLACYTLMLGWDSIEKLPKTISVESAWDVAYMQDSILDRIFIEHQKPSHDALLPSITIHARNDWSERHVDDDIDTIKSQLLKAAQQALNWNDHTAPSQIDCHRWRYASTVIDENSKPSGILVDESRQWIVSGDWCHRGNIESAYQMAEQTAKNVIGSVFNR